MRTLIAALAVTGTVAGPAVAQDAGMEMGERLDVLTCSEFLQFEAQDQMTVMLALRAHSYGDPLPDEPLPIGLEAESSADGLGGDSGDASAEGLETGAEAAGAVEGLADTAGDPAGEAGGEGADGADSPDESGIVDGENESGQVNVDGTEASVTDGPADPKLTAMRTSCEGGPEALAADAMRAAHADYE